MYSVVLPNPDLKPEESINVEIGVNGDYKSLFSDSDRFVFHANVFRDRVKNLINAGATGDMDFTDDGDMILYYSIDNVGKALKTGFEASADYYPATLIFICLTVICMRKIKTQEKRFRDSLQCRQLLEPVIPTSLGMLTDGIVCVSSKEARAI